MGGSIQRYGGHDGLRHDRPHDLTTHSSGVRAGRAAGHVAAAGADPARRLSSAAAPPSGHHQPGISPSTDLRLLRGSNPAFAGSAVPGSDKRLAVTQLPALAG